MTIYMMRHGKTLANEQKYYATPTEPLLPVEPATRMKLKEEVAGLSVTSVVTSPYLRAKETAAMIWDRGPVEEEVLIREVNLGVLEGHNFHDAYDMYGEALRPWIDDPFTYGPPAGESLREAYKRARDFLQIAKEDTLYISHDGFMRLVLCAVEGDVHGFFNYKLENFEIIEIDKK